MARFLRYCLCFVLSFPALAFSADRVVVVEPSQIKRTYTPGSPPYAFNDSRSWDQPVSTQSGRVKVPVKTDRKYGFPSFRSGLKNALKLNPTRIIGNAVVAGAVGAVGWVMSDGVLVKKTSDGEPISPDLHGWVAAGGSWCGGQKFTSPTNAQTCIVDALKAYLGSRYTVEPNGFTMINSNLYQVNQKVKNLDYGWVNTDAFNTTISRQGSCPSPYIIVNDTCVTDDPKFSPVTDADLDSLTSGITSPADAAAVAPDVIQSVPGSYDYPDGYDFSGPESITGDPVVTTTTTPSGTEVSTTTPSYSFDYSTNPLSITTTTTNTTTVYNNGTLVSTSTTTNNQGVVDVSPEPSSEVPTDCEFMPTVCEFIAWFKTPAELQDPDMPEPADDDFEQTYSASFGGACPAPRTVHTDNFGTLSISWQPICDLAFYIKFLVIGGASLFAAYIGLGISRGNS